MEEETPMKKLLIPYATQTGNASDFAERVGREAGRRSCPIHLLSLDQYDARCLVQEGTVIFVVSTNGQDDTPDPLKGFWKDLVQKQYILVTFELWFAELNPSRSSKSNGQK